MMMMMTVAEGRAVPHQELSEVWLRLNS